MKAGALIFILLLWSLTDAGAQYIAELLEYTPAPGQLVNVSPWGTPAGASSIEGGLKGTVSLGAFGGYVVFRFEQPVENDPRNPYGIDFTIFGNPMPDWSEPDLSLISPRVGFGNAENAGEGFTGIPTVLIWVSFTSGWPNE